MRGGEISKAKSLEREKLYKKNGIGCYEVNVAYTNSVIDGSLTHGFGRFMNHAMRGATARPYPRLLQVNIQINMNIKY